MKKPIRSGTCKHCERSFLFLMPTGYCPVCDEDEELVQHFSRVARVDRLREQMAYSARMAKKRGGLA